VSVILSDEAKDDLYAIWHYVSGNNPEAADALIVQVNEKLDMLAQNPYAGRQRDELRHGIRSLVLGSCLIFYRFTAPDVTITRIVHGSRDIPTLFGPSSGNNL